MKKFLLLICILIIGVIVFNSSCSSVVKEPSTVRFTELDKEIQDTLFAIWYHDYKKVTVDTEYVESINEYWVHETTAPIDFIDFSYYIISSFLYYSWSTKSSNCNCIRIYKFFKNSFCVDIKLLPLRNKNI